MSGSKAVALTVAAIAVLGGCFRMANTDAPSLLDESLGVRSTFSVTSGGADSSAYLDQLQKRVEQGEPDAQLELAGYLRSGEGQVKRDLAKAVQLYQTAANGGIAEAATELADIYWHSKDTPKAIEWSLRAVELGDGSAAAVVGWTFLKGEDGAPNYPEGAKWFERGAQKGDSHCQYFLGRMHETGLGIPVDYKAAYFWCKLSSEGGHPPARRAVERISKHLEPSEVTEADKRVVDWLKQH